MYSYYIWHDLIDWTDSPGEQMETLRSQGAPIRELDSALASSAIGNAPRMRFHTAASGD